jgi:phosphohistidine phosphatase
MKTLFIMRHAKSSWNYPDLSDFDRPLSSHGLKTAPFMGDVMYKNRLQPSLIISSTAKRAKQTAVLVKEVAEIKSKIEFNEKIYEASPATLYYIASGISDEHESAILIGHNPGIEGFIRIITNEKQSMSSASIVKIKLNIERWNELTDGCGFIEILLRPEDLMEEEEKVAEYSQSLW